MDCVLHKASSHTTGPPAGSTRRTALKAGALASPCIALVRLTPTGFVYDEKATAPTTGDAPFNCDPENVKTVKSYLTS